MLDSSPAVKAIFYPLANDYDPVAAKPCCIASNKVDGSGVARGEEPPVTGLIAPFGCLNDDNS